MQLRTMLLLFTLPYAHALNQYTISPLKKIAECQKDDFSQLAALIEAWRNGKEHELRFIQVAVRCFPKCLVTR
jgi:hypothetical protein